MEMITYKIFGPDSPTFLQGLLTCDIAALDNSPLFAACCNQKGRIIANFWIHRDNDEFYFTLPKLMGEILKQHLQKYLLRSKVQIEALDKPTSIKYDNHPIWILPETTEQFTPQMIDLQKYGGVSFKKGCYLGQEIIARTEHLGQLKRHLYRIDYDNRAPFTIGDVIQNTDGQKMGMVVAIHNDNVFAVIEDRAIDQTLFIDENKLTRIIRDSASVSQIRRQQ